MVDNFLCLLVVEPSVRFDDGFTKPLIMYPGLIVYLEYSRKTKLFLIRTERTNIVGKFFRQHGHYPINKIHRGTPFISFLFEDGVRPNIVCNVSNVDTYFPQSVL